MSLSWLYRKYLRQVRRLPHHYLRQFFKIKASDDFRAVAATPSHKVRLWKSRLKRTSNDLRQIENALSGRRSAFNHILDLAYGRKGKLRWELMELLTKQPETGPPGLLIPSVPNSRPPVYSAELTALLLNSTSRSHKALQPRQLRYPPTLSPRANSESEEARLLGPLSKRLEFNTRWRYFRRECSKVHPPLEIVVKRTDGKLSTTATDVALAGSKPLAFQDKGLLNDIESIVAPSDSISPITRKERLLPDVEFPPDNSSQRHPSKWLRRRYQNLLGKIPVLICNPHPKKPVFNVNLPSSSISIAGRSAAHRRPNLDPVNLAWFERANALHKKKIRGTRLT